MRIFPFVALLIFGLILNCTREEVPPAEGLVIQAGFVCGWGSGKDSIQITRSSIRYRYYVPRESGQPKIDKTRELTSVEWEELQGCVNWRDFVRLEYNTCNVCFDGCDEWIAMKEGAAEHKISFSQGQTIESIRILQDKMAQYRNELGKN